MTEKILKDNDEFDLFIYGTLREGGGLHDAYSFGRADKKVWTKPNYTLYDAGCPILVPRGTSKVFGEIYHVTFNDIRSVHYMETGAGYQLGRVELDGNRHAYGYMYAYDPGGREIDGGDWIRYCLSGRHGGY